MKFNITITEALAEIKTIGKRVEKKKQFIGQYLLRQERLKDPLEKEGGSVEGIRRERQAIRDLQQRAVDIRLAIDAANEASKITVADQTRSIAEWLIWRREVAPAEQKFLGEIRSGIERVRQDVTKKGGAMVSVGDAAKPDDIIVHINEGELAKEIEAMETILGALDGQLSLKNATIVI